MPSAETLLDLIKARGLSDGTVSRLLGQDEGFLRNVSQSGAPLPHDLVGKLSTIIGVPVGQIPGAVPSAPGKATTPSPNVGVTSKTKHRRSQRRPLPSAPATGTSPWASLPAVGGSPFVPATEPGRLIPLLGQHDIATDTLRIDRAMPVALLEAPACVRSCVFSFAVYVHRDSLTPGVPQGGTAFVAPGRPARPNDIILVEYRDHRVEIGRLVRSDTRSFAFVRIDQAAEMTETREDAIHHPVVAIFLH